MGKILFTGILSALGLFFLTGCQNQLGYETEIRRITIKTEPQNAKVYQVNPVDKHLIYLGMSPVEAQPVNVITKFSGTDNRQVYDYLTTQLYMVNIRVEKEGFVPYEGNLPTEEEDILLHRIELESL